MKLLLTRHAETLENARSVVQGYGGTISPLGERQSKKLALRLRDEKIDHIYSSDLARAIKLTDEIRLFHSKIPLTLTKKLREVDFTKYLRTPIKDVNWRYVRDLESQEHLQTRAKCFYDELVAKTASDETALVVGHAGTIKAITSVLLDIHYNKIWDMDTPKNCSLSSFEISDEGIEIITLNNIGHLEGLN